jgi:hypothetical protein
MFGKREKFSFSILLKLNMTVILLGASLSPFLVFHTILPFSFLSLIAQEHSGYLKILMKGAQEIFSSFLSLIAQEHSGYLKILMKGAQEIFSLCCNDIGVFEFCKDYGITFLHFH